MTGDSSVDRAKPPDAAPANPPDRSNAVNPSPAPSPNVDATPVSDGNFLAKFRRWAMSSRAIRWITLSLSLTSLPLSVACVWYCWFMVIPSMATWGWGPQLDFITRLASGIGIFFVALLPIYPPIGAVVGLLWVLEIFADVSQQSLNHRIAEGSRRQRAAEDELMQPGQAGLIGLVRYSRVQLESYYHIGLDQTQRSFRYSVMAMWLGFLVILTAVIPRVFNLNRYGITPPDNSVSVVVTLAGVIIEIISALFLWMYTSSVRNLKYFYDRQMFYHTVMICRTIALDIKDSDEVVKMIIERTMNRAWDLDMPELPQGIRARGWMAREDGTGMPPRQPKGAPKTGQSSPIDPAP